MKKFFDEPLLPLILLLGLVILVMMARYALLGEVSTPLLTFIGPAFGALVAAIAARSAAKKKQQQEEEKEDGHEP